MTFAQPVDLARFTAAAKAADARADEIDASRRLPEDLAAQLISTGVMKTWVPTAYGGHGGSVMDLVNAVEHISYYSGSAGWCSMIGITTGLMSGFLPPKFGEELFASPGACGGGLAAPIGVATVVDGGLEVTGEWAWGSGTSHCTTIAGGVRIADSNGERATLADGAGACFAFFDLADVELLDTWHTSGLRGSGSTHYKVEKAFVPEGRWVAMANMPKPVDDNPLYRFSAFGALSMGVTAVLMGLARRATDELVALANKPSAGSKRVLAERAVVQSQLARAEAAVLSSRAFVESAVGQCWDAAVEGAMDDRQKGLLRLAAADTASRCADAVDLCYNAGGGTTVYKANPLERVFRDAHVATQHQMVAERILEPLGRMRFGLPTSTAQF